MWALEHGVTLALANKESLVAAGDLALAARERGGGALIPVDSEHSALFQCALAGEPEAIVLTASGGPFRGRTRDELADVTPERGARAPDLEHGREDHDRLGDAREQGPRGDRGALPLRAAVRAASRSSCIRRRSSTGSCASATAPRSRTSATPTCACPISYALTYPERAATPIPPLDLTAGPLEFFEPDPETFRMLALAREAGERGGTYPCAFNAANEVAVAAFLDGRIGFLEIAALVEDALGRVDGAPARDLDELRRGRPPRTRAGGDVWAS